MSPNETDAVKRQRSCTAARISTVEEETSDDSHSDSEMEEEAIYINDPVHGMLEIHPLCKAVIDTPEFQRLRFIKQCGISYFVYPGATHTRFDHSLGVCYLALKVVKRLNELESNAVSPEESLCIQLAGLCHDLGHGPFSHFWEYFVSYATNTKFHHEDMSIKIFDYLIEKNSLREKFAKYGLYDEHLQLIKDLIMGTPSRYKTMTPELFLFEIVANKENGLDIDKYEYLIKDSYFFGTEVSPDFERYLTCLKIVEDPELGVKHIGYREKLKTNIISVFKHRAVMHDIGYQHRVCKKIEAMLLDALIIADKQIEISVDNGEKYKLSECHENIEAILQLTDNLFEKILYSREESLKEAKNILIRILNRKHYKQIYKTDLNDIKTMKGVEAARKFSDLLKPIGERYNINFHCRTKELELGQNGNACDPLKNVWFVSRNGTVSRPEKDPFFLPKETTSKKLFVFCKDDVEEEIKKKVRDIIETAKIDFKDQD